MKTAPYLTFQLRHLNCGIELSQILEIFPLPELQPVPEAPGDIVGILNLRGKLLPIMDLSQRLGLPTAPFRASDNIVVIDCLGTAVGLIVNQLEDTLTITEAQIATDLSYGRDQHVNTGFLQGVATVEDRMYLLFDPIALVRMADEVAKMIWDAEHTGEPDSSSGLDGMADGQFFERYCPQSTAAEQALMQKRAIELRQPLEDESKRNLTPLAVVDLEGQFFGIELSSVREFVDIPTIHPIPCCPSHIVGNMNLRGEVMTLIDVRQALNLSAASHHEQPKAIVAQVGEIVAGITVNEVRDILYLHPSEVQALPAGLEGKGYLRGNAPYEQGMLSILDLQQLLTANELVVSAPT